MNAQEKRTKKINATISNLFQIVIQLEEEQQKELLDHADQLLVKERRQNLRKSCNIPINYASSDRVYSNQISNISANGLFIDTNQPIMTDNDLIMTFRLEGFAKSLKIRGKIARTTEKGVGVEFKNISPHVEDMIRYIVKHMK